MTADKLTAADYYRIQQAASLTFNLIHDTMSRTEPCSHQWEALRALGGLAKQIADISYEAASALAAAEMPAPCSRANAHTPHDRCPGTF